MTSSASHRHHPNNAVSPGRRLALHATSQARIREGYVRDILDSALDSEEGITVSDRAFAMRLSCGVMATRGTLDEIIDRSLRSRDDIDDDVRDALRISTFEMAFLGKQPYACVSQGVELTRSVARKADRLANAVLRKIAADLDTFPWGDPDTDDAALARSFGQQLWITRRLIDAYGRQAAQEILACTLLPAPLYVAVNRNRADADRVVSTLISPQVLASPFGPDGCYLVPSRTAVLESGLIDDGHVLFCDAAAQTVATLPLSRAHGNFLEVGSGRGTKTILIQGGALIQQGQRMRIHALELHANRCRRLSSRLAACNVSDVTVHCGDATDLHGIANLPSTFSGALIDAPCSGLGTMRRHPERCWDCTPGQITELAELGMKLLASVAPSIADGGSIVYSTCTILPEENSSVIDSFLASREGRDFVRQDVRGDLPREMRDSVDASGDFQTLPSIDRPDGHFAAVLTRKGTGR